MDTYSATLFVHSWARWIVVAAALFALVRAAGGVASRRAWSGLDDRAGLIFTIALDVQLLVGLYLYFVASPFTRMALSDFGGAMRDSGLRFWAVEHVFGALVVIALAHIGRVRTRKADGVRRHRTALIFYGLATLVMLAIVPWPGTANGRPWIR